jgi:hypothetical protein
LPALFHDGFFWDRVSQTIWLWTTILLISAFWVARIATMSHQSRASVFCIHPSITFR